MNARKCAILAIPRNRKRARKKNNKKKKKDSRSLTFGKRKREPPIAKEGVSSLQLRAEPVPRTRFVLIYFLRHLCCLLQFFAVHGIIIFFCFIFLKILFQISCPVTTDLSVSLSPPAHPLHQLLRRRQRRRRRLRRRRRRGRLALPPPPLLLGCHKRAGARAGIGQAQPEQGAHAEAEEHDGDHQDARGGERGAQEEAGGCRRRGSEKKR